MANEDIARIGTDWRKRYFATGMQQGRPLMEEDWNENRRLTSEEKRRALRDIIGDVGTPDSGFKIEITPAIAAAIAAGGPLDFQIDNGTLYLGGQRLEMLAPESYRLQSDWLEQSGDENVAPPANPGDTLTTVAYVEAWEQPVTAVEDSELYEPALGGPDTSTRLRMMRRVHLASVPAGTGTCEDAWTALTKTWSAANLGTIGAGGERLVDTTLSVTFTAASNTDLCNPPVAGGYLGADNQAIRVQLTDAAHFTWGFDDASPVYRVTVSKDANGQPTIVKLLTPPKDEAHWLLTGMVVEILAWSAVLPNNEKLAEIQGFMTRVKASYDPDTQTLQIVDPLAPPPPPLPTPPFGTAWQSRSDAGTLSDPQHPPFFYLRVWDRGGDTLSPVQIPLVPPPVALGTTGLSVTFGGNDAVAGDYWVIGARPSTPTEVVPWRLITGAPPHGIRRFYAPLAVIVWNNVAGAVSGTIIDDCRPPFLPLTALRGCCTIIVGDGIETFGDVTSVQAAVDALPPEGGEICVLPGTYPGFVSLSGHHSVIIQGCEGRSILTPPTGDFSTTPVISLDGSSGDILIRDLAIQATTGPGISWDSPLLRSPIKNITLSELDISARDMSAIFGRGGIHVVVELCTIQIQQLASQIDPAQPAGLFPGIFLLGDDMRIERNDVFYVGKVVTTQTPLGGIQIGGGSAFVEIRRNRIIGGLGNGITLGSVRLSNGNDTIDGYRTHGVTSGSDQGTYAPYGMVMDPGGCVNVGPPSIGPQPPGARPPISEGAVSRVRIIDNQIAAMGNDGIATISLYDDSNIYILIFILWIEENEIRNCVRLPRDTSQNAPLLRARGGIILADAESAWIRGNTIVNNGTLVTEPICGIYLQHATDVDISFNRINANGVSASRILHESSFTNTISGAALVPAGGTALGEVGGGIVIDLALVSSASMRVQYSYLATTGDVSARRMGVGEIIQLLLEAEKLGATGGVAVRIEANEVSAPNGRALELVASGQVAVHGNSFAAASTRGFDILGFLFGNDKPRRPLDFLGGAAVAILDLGISHELLTDIFGYLLLPFFESLDPGVGGELVRHLAGGNVQFNDNQVELNLLNQQIVLTLSSVLLLSADDIAMQDNQCDVLARLIAFDLVLFHALSIGVSVRMMGNRMKEGSLAALIPTLSGATLGIFNTTAENQGTHCFLALGLLVAGNTHGLNNLSLIGGSTCNRQTDAIAGNMNNQFVAAPQ